MARWFQAHLGVIAFALVVVGFACTTWDGFYYVIRKERIVSEAASFRWYLAGQAIWFCAFLVVLIPRLRQIR